MNRRTFINAASAFAGLALAPAWGVFKQRREIDLTQFCAEWSGGRYDISKPFAQGGFSLATDGRILLRTSLADVPELSGVRKLPNVAGIPYWKQSGSWRPWPKPSYLPGKWEACCPHCDGKGGHNASPCVACSGCGYKPLGPSGEYESPCSTCRATGWLSAVECDFCNGSGYTDKACYQPIGGIVIAPHYDARLRRLGELEFRHDADCVQFRGDGFEGLLMGKVTA